LPATAIYNCASSFSARIFLATAPTCLSTTSPFLKNNFVEMHSNELRVDINDKFLESLAELPGVEYKLN